MRERAWISFFGPAVILSLVLLSGCFDSKSFPNESHTLQETSSEQTSAGSLPEIKQDVFLNISEETASEGYTLYAADLYNDDAVALLYADPDTFAYYISLYTIKTGKETVVYKDTLVSDDNYVLSPDNFTVVHSSPLIIEDIWTTTLYVFSEDFTSVQTVETGVWNSYEIEYLESTNSIYFQNSENNSMYRYDLLTEETSEAFTDKLGYQSLWLEEILEDSHTAVFSGSRISDSLYVDILVDLDTGKPLYETTGDMKFYESDGKIFAVREDENNLNIGVLDEENSMFKTCCEIELDDYYQSMYFDQAEGLLFISTPEDTAACRLFCFDLEKQTLRCVDSFDVSGYLPQDLPVTVNDGTGDFDSEEGSYSEDSISLKFTGSGSAIPETDEILFSVVSPTGIEDILIWNYGGEEEQDEALPSSASWSSILCTIPETNSVYADNSEYASALTEKYGVSILLGEDAVIPFQNYEAEEMDEEGTTYRALCVMEKTLALYPDNFFRQFTDESLSGITFYLVGDISPTGENSIDDPGGFAYLNNGIQMIVLNAEYTGAMQKNICHEISHAIDRRLENLGFQSDTVYLDEGVWASFNPRGFSYYYSYLDENGDSYEYAGSDDYTSYSSAFWTDGGVNAVFFVDIYSKTYPTEDRARLMETSMTEGGLPDYMKSVHIQRKLNYYFSAIRSAWDTAGWPAQASWEKALIK